MNEPRITVEITFLRADEGGRQTAPKLPGHEFLHVVIQDRSVRQAKTQGGEIQELYHPLRIVQAPTTYEVGQSARFVVTPMYYPHNQFPEFNPGVTFTCREGARIVAHGVVLSRDDGLGISSGRARPDIKPKA